MNSDLVLSKALSQKLVEAGVVLETEYSWAYDFSRSNKSHWALLCKGYRLACAPKQQHYPAPLTDELLRVMPARLLKDLFGRQRTMWFSVSKGTDNKYLAGYEVDGELYPSSDSYDTATEALGSLILVPEVLEVVKRNMKEDK